MRRLRIALVFLGLWIATSTLPALAAGPNASTTETRVPYLVQKGDTLEAIAVRLTGDADLWRPIAAANKLQRAERLRTGSTLWIPAQLIPQRSSVAKILAANGSVTIKDGAAAAPGNVGEGAQVSTGVASSVLVELQDGTRIKIEPGSTIILERMRQYYASDAVDARIRLESGRIDVDSPGKRPYPLEVKTRRGTAAVRGTAFRVSADGDANTTEVLRGLIDYGVTSQLASGKALQLPDGKGAALAANSDQPVVEALSPAPILKLKPVYDQIEAALTWEPAISPVAVSRYRLIVSRDAAALDVVVNSLRNEAGFDFTSPDDGSYFLQVRAISNVGIEGLSASQPFEVSARPLPPEFETIGTGPDATGRSKSRLIWKSAPATKGTVVQIATDLAFNTLLLNQETEGNQIDLPDAHRGKQVYFRLASVQERDGRRKRGPFGKTYEIFW